MKNTAVTKENFQELGTVYIRANGGAVISLRADKQKGIEVKETPRQWGAWLAYFKARDIPTHFMEYQGKMGKSWTVPAEWAHEFDGESDPVLEREAADRFIKTRASERQFYMDAATRKQVVLAAMRKPYFGPRVIETHVYSHAVKVEDPTHPHERIKPQGYWTDPNFDREAYERLIKP